MAKTITEIRAINGPYPPTFDGIENAIEACGYDRGEFGETEENSKLVIVRADGSQETVLVQAMVFGEAYEAAEIAHRFGIEHDQSICSACLA